MFKCCSAAAALLTIALALSFAWAQGPGKFPPPPGGPPGKGGGAPFIRGKAPASGIQWFATWDSGKLEAARSGKPILLISGAPHTAGVSGCW